MDALLTSSLPAQGRPELPEAAQRNREHAQPRAGVDEWSLTEGMNDEAA